MERRATIRKNLHVFYRPVFDAMCEQLGEHWQPYCGLRGMIEQERLWQQGRTLPGPIVTNAKSGESPHNYGCASDWALFDGKNFSWPPASDSIWSEFGDAVHKAGGRWGGDWHDSPHAELKLSVPWRDVLPHYRIGGFATAWEYVNTVKG